MRLIKRDYQGSTAGGEEGRGFCFSGLVPSSRKCAVKSKIYWLQSAEGHPGCSIYQYHRYRLHPTVIEALLHGRIDWNCLWEEMMFIITILLKHYVGLPAYRELSLSFFIINIRFFIIDKVLCNHLTSCFCGFSCYHV